MITVTFNEATLSFASDSDADDWVDDEIFLENDLEISESEIGYASQLNDMQSLLVLNIFAMGVLAGVMMGVVLWGKL
ncbi:hypothetical protein [Clostridium sp. AF32-12BH]|uniref:hypothetical protein n=1 Tax=Clostridium sp. AF32-12BH TaxID=2292006 RepID=UPI000E53B0E7|nr:hypothetical protein [Clostridium sp. AF32-12BH]RHP49160.1 hypothetical protein DWZ40_02775 [Clostridium sp. AF32-12BH]